MKQFCRGQKSKLSDLGLSDAFTVNLDMQIDKNAPGFSVDVTCFGLDQAGKLSDDRYMIFYNQKSAPGNAINFTTEQNQFRFQTNLSALPASIDKLVFAASTDADKSMRALGSCQMTIGDGLCFPFSGADFLDEKAIIIGELYRRDGAWRFGSVGQGFNGGLSALLKHFGGTEAAPTSAPTSAPTAAPTPPAPTPKPAPAPESKKISLSKVTLEKRGDKISLEKQGKQAFGRIRINLNWNQQAPAPAAPEKAGFFNKLFNASPAKKRGGIDLDLACLFELADGRKSAVQALGEGWGSYDHPPYIHLEGDDRTGAITTGENMFINGAQFDKIKRILIYTFIYEGAPNWAVTNGVVTVEIPGQPPVEVQLDNGTNSPMCAIALIENIGGNIQVTKLVEYFSGHGKISPHEEMDQRYKFGLRWGIGSKD